MSKDEVEMYLKLSSVVFPIEEIVISADVVQPYIDIVNGHEEEKNPGLLWAIKVRTAENKFLDSELTIACEGFKIPVTNWTGLPGISVNYRESDDEDESVCLSYVNAWNIIPRFTLEILERIGNKFSINWHGIVNPYGESADQRYVDMPFEIMAQATFSHINVRGREGDTESTLRDKLASFISIDNLTQQPLKTHGANSCLCTFTPSG